MRHQRIRIKADIIRLRPGLDINIPDRHHLESIPPDLPVAIFQIGKHDFDIFQIPADRKNDKLL